MPLRRLLASLLLAAPLLASASDLPGNLPPSGPPGGPPTTPPGQDNPLPEPGSLVLVGLAVVGAVAARRRK